VSVVHGGSNCTPPFIERQSEMKLRSAVLGLLGILFPSLALAQTCPQILYKVVSAASYQLQPIDNCAWVEFVNTGAITVVLPDPSGFNPAFFTTLIADNGGALTLSSGSSATVNLGTSLTLGTNGGANLKIFSRNWLAFSGGGGGGSGSGTVASGTAGQIAEYGATGTTVRGATVSGDVTYATGGAFSIGAGKVTNAMLAGLIDLTSKVTGALPSANMVACTSTVGGRVPTPPNDATQYLDGTCAFSTPPGTAVVFVGPITAGSANTYTQAVTTPTGFTLTDGYVVRTRINATNTAASTLAVNGLAAKAIKTNTATGIAALAGGELIAALEYDFTYNTTCTCFVVQTLPLGAVVAGTTQTITAAQWATTTVFDVTTASQTLTVPVSTGLSPNGMVVVKADSQSVTITATSPDTINGGGAGGSVTIPSGVLALLTTDGAGHLYVNVGQTIPVGANPTATAGSAAVNGSASTFMRSDGAPALPVASSSVFGIAKVDNTTITASGGVISAVGGGSGGGLLQYSDNGLTLTAGTRYVPVGGSGVPSTTEADYSTKAPSALTVNNLQVNLSADPGSGQTLAVTLRKNGSDTTLTCTVTGPLTPPAAVCQDLTHSIAIAQNDLINWKVVTTGTFVATPSLTILANSGTTNNGITGSGTANTVGKFTGSASEGNSSITDDGTTVTMTAGAVVAGASGTLGSLKMGNATSGTATLQPVTGALGTVTASLPANTGTIAELNLNQAWTAGQAVTPDTATQCGTQSAAGTMTPNFALSNSCVATFGAGNLTIANPTNVKAGQTWILSLTQDGTGSRTVTWGSQYKWAGGTAPTLSTAASAKDVISCFSDTTTTHNCTLAVKGAS
jgi:hypothetical protein